MVARPSLTQEQELKNMESVYNVLLNDESYGAKNTIDSLHGKQFAGIMDWAREKKDAAISAVKGSLIKAGSGGMAGESLAGEAGPDEKSVKTPSKAARNKQGKTESEISFKSLRALTSNKSNLDFIAKSQARVKEYNEKMRKLGMEPLEQFSDIVPHYADLDALRAEMMKLSETKDLDEEAKLLGVLSRAPIKPILQDLDKIFGTNYAEGHTDSKIDPLDWLRSIQKEKASKLAKIEAFVKELTKRRADVAENALNLKKWKLERGFAVDKEQNDRAQYVARNALKDVGTVAEVRKSLRLAAQMFDPRMVGPVSGRFNKVKDALLGGSPVGFWGSEEDAKKAGVKDLNIDTRFTLLRGALADIKARVGKLTYGAQQSAKELENLIQMMPNPELGVDAFLGRLFQFMENLNLRAAEHFSQSDIPKESWVLPFEDITGMNASQFIEALHEKKILGAGRASPVYNKTIQAIINKR